MNETPDPAQLRSMPGAWPHVGVFALCVDISLTSALIIHRSPEVRSAKDCWGLPGGLLDIGETIRGAVIRELREEVQLEVYSFVPDSRTTYENIAWVDGYHWVLTIDTVVIEDLFAASVPEEERDKCDAIEVITIDALERRLGDSVASPDPKGILKWAPNLAVNLLAHICRLRLMQRNNELERVAY